MNFKKILALLTAVMMLLSFAACGETKDEGKENPATTVPQETEPQATEPQETQPQLAQITFLTINVSDAEGNVKSIYITDNTDGTASVDFSGDVIKRGEVDASALATVTAALSESGLIALNGRNEGDSTISMACGSMYADLSDGTILDVNFYGEVPEEFLNGYAVLEACMNNVTAEMAEYVPAPMEMGEIAESDRTAINDILAVLDLGVALDSFAISGIAKDEYFAATLGLSSDEGIASGLNFASMMMSVAYGVNIVTLEDGADVNAVAEDFKNNIDWRKWVCVEPSDALIATKGNQVLCVLASDDAYTATATAVETAGWTTYATLENENR